LIKEKEEQELKVEDDPFESNSYWRIMYEDLEDQMKQMMAMTLTLVETETSTKENELIELKNKLKRQEKELKKYKQFQHSIKVTWIGKIALFYIRVKRRIKRAIS